MNNFCSMTENLDLLESIPLVNYVPTQIMPTWIDIWLSQLSSNSVCCFITLKPYLKVFLLFEVSDLLG